LAAQRSRAARFLVLWSGPVCKVSEEDIYSIFMRDADALATRAPAYRQALDSRTAPYVWPDFLGVDTDSSKTLKSLSIPGLWIFSDNDGSIPVDLSIHRLKSLQRAGHHYEYVLFSGLGHNNMDPTFHVATEWIRQRVTTPVTGGATRSATRQ
jgi:pimeloyl-ACP methyl ester carboxylesterase